MGESRNKMKTRFPARVKDLVVFSLIASATHLAAAPQLVTAVGSSFPAKLGGSGDSGLSIISPDGRYILFASMANNLTSTNYFNLAQPFQFNVFMRDSLNQTTRLASVNQNGIGGNGSSFPTGISTNGQFALFESSASDLVANDTNNASDIFLRDLVNGNTTLVSVSTNGGSASGSSRGSVLTPNGRYVAFVCTASDLVAGDTNGIPDVFVRDLQTGLTTLVSVGAMPTNPSTLLSSSESPEITPDGRYVVFYSTATNLAPNVLTPNEIYVRDLVVGQTFWASTNARAIAQSVTGSSNIVCCNYSISDDGQFVAFEACSNAPGYSGTAGIILRYSLQTGLTDLICTNANVPVLSYELIHNLSLSPDGRFVAFVAGRSITTNAIDLWDAQTGTNALVSGSLDNVTPTTGLCDLPVLSSNGRFVAFISSATNLVTNPLAAGFHMYVRDLQAGATQLLDTDTNGVGAGVDSMAAPAMSADGSVVVFDCTGLLSDNRHLIDDVFAHTVASGVNELASASDPDLVSQTPNGSSGFTSFGTSSNGQFVAFYSDADDLVANDTNGCRDVFVRDLAGGTNILVSVNTNGRSGNGFSTDPSISGDGRYVAFVSWADDLVNGDTNQAMDVFVRDLQAGTTALVSVSKNGTGPGNGSSFSPAISADGRYVLFHSLAANLATGSFGSSIENLFFRDMQTGTTYPLTAPGQFSTAISAAMTPDGKNVAFIGTPQGGGATGLYVWNSQLATRTYTNSEEIANSQPIVAISRDGRKLAYLAGEPVSLFAADLAAGTVMDLNPGGMWRSHAGLRFSDDGRFLTYAAGTIAAPGQNIYRYDFQLGTNLLLSQNYNFSGAANTNSDSPAISPDGRFIAYRSFATNLVPFDTDSVAEMFVYDASNNATIVVSLDAAGNPAADRSLKPVFSGDSRSLFFQSWAPDINSHDFNNASDLFELDLTDLPLTGTNGLGGNPAGAFSVQLFPTGIFNTNPTLTWPLAAGRVYHVQFKTNLTDAIWQNLPADLNVSGGTGYVSDPAPMTTGPRFYRINSSP
jgi:Tol biopolymer transport system component